MAAAATMDDFVPITLAFSRNVFARNVVRCSRMVNSSLTAPNSLHCIPSAKSSLKVLVFKENGSFNAIKRKHASLLGYLFHPGLTWWRNHCLNNDFTKALITGLCDRPLWPSDQSVHRLTYRPCRVATARSQKIATPLYKPLNFVAQGGAVGQLMRLKCVESITGVAISQLCLRCRYIYGGCLNLKLCGFGILRRRKQSFMEYLDICFGATCWRRQ